MPTTLQKDPLQERFLGPLNVKQSVYAGMATAIIIFLWLFSGVESMIIKVAITFAIFAATVWMISAPARV